MMDCHCNRMLGASFEMPIFANPLPKPAQPPLTQTPTERTKGESIPHRLPFAAWYITRKNGQTVHPTPHLTEGFWHHTRHLPPTPLISLRSHGTTLLSLWLAFVISDLKWCWMMFNDVKWYQTLSNDISKWTCLECRMMLKDVTNS